MSKKSAMIRLVLVLGFVFSSASAGVFVDQVGYKPSVQKSVYSNQPADAFSVVDLSNQAVLFTGKFALWKTQDASSGMTVYRGDFSLLTKTGLYAVRTSSGEESAPFAIQDSVYRPVLKSSLKGFFFQRCGTALPLSFANIYMHPICHSSDATFHSTAESLGTIVATGGWHDAGDYGKYVVNAGVTVGTLLAAYETFPDRFGADDIGIPESGNGTPDILDETRYELEWLLKMQASSGAVFDKVTHAQFEGFIMPQSDNGIRYIYQIASTATGDFAAMMARAARVYQMFDPTFAQRCLAAAVKAWQFLEKSPSIVPAGGFRNPAETGTGEYGDNDDFGERLWAAAELLATTREAKYKTYYNVYYSQKSLLNQSMSWQNVAALAHLTYLKTDFPGKDSSIVRALKASLQSFCQTHVNRRNASAFPVTLVPGEYVWGSNSVALNNAILLIFGAEILVNAEYRDVALDQLHYILGVNPLGTSYVTGVGAKRPFFPHHRPSAADNIFEPVPGLLAGGPNQYRNDPVLELKFTSSSPPATCYADDQASYASNEITINWNAPLVFVVGYFAYPPTVTEVGSREDVVPSSIRLSQNYPNPFNGATVIPFENTRDQYLALSFFDALGREVDFLDLGFVRSGTHTVRWDTGAGRRTSLSSGAYFCRVASPDLSITLRLLLAK